jgi:DNA polymerase-2
MKVRGVEYRRGDTPVYFKLCQKQIFEALSKCDSAEELRKVASTECVQIFHEFASRLERNDVSPIELMITRRLSKNLEEYRSKRQLSVSATSKLAQQGLKLQAGQSVSYVISNYRTAGMNRAVPEELVENVRYDSERYVELLGDCCATVLSPLGVTKQMLLLRSQSLL